MDRDYVKDIVRMVIMGLGLVALSHIYTNFKGVAVVDFIEVFCDVAENEFMVDEYFVPFFRNIKTTDELERGILLKSDKTGWS